MEMLISDNKRRIEIAVLATLLSLLCIFVVVSEFRLASRERHELSEQAQIIENELWNFDSQGARVYLTLTSRLYNYKSVTVYTEDDEVFVRVAGPEPHRISRILIGIGLIPSEVISADVLHDGELIGRLEAIHRHDKIYLYLNLLLIIGLVILVSRYYLRNALARETLEARVEQRAGQLQLANEKLLAGEKRYREIYNAPSEAIFMHDARTGRILDANQGALQMYGFSYQEILDVEVETLSSGVPPYGAPEAARKIGRAVTDGPQTFEWQSKRKDSSLFWSEVSLKYTEFGGQGYVIAVVRDINERKLAEEALAAEKEQLLVTLRSIGDGVITTDVEGRVLLLNRVAEELTGWVQNEAVGRHLADVLQVIDAQTRESGADPVGRVVAAARIVELTNDALLIDRAGRERSIADSGAPIRDQNGEIVGVVLVIRDVTERNRMEEAINKGRKLESVGVLAGGIAHDFNNILTSILGNISLAMGSLNDEEELRELLQQAEKASFRAQGLTQQLLTFARGGEPVKQLADIGEIVKDSANFVLSGSNVRCDFRLDENLRLVEIDSGQISQVIQNLIVNAKQAMPVGGSVDVFARNVELAEGETGRLAAGDYIELIVRDHGAGIAPEMIDKVFDPYFTTKMQGSGLGLAITHSIISKHGGHISLVSNRDEGTTFTIYLPASEESAAVPGDGGEAEHEFTADGRVLVMDDDEMIRTLTGEMLSRMGFDVLPARSGEEAVDAYLEARAAGSPIALVILDLTVPGGMSGSEAARQILLAEPEAKIVVASGYSNDPIMASYREYGFCAALAKPYMYEDLKRVLSQAIAL